MKARWFGLLAIAACAKPTVWGESSVSSPNGPWRSLHRAPPDAMRVRLGDCCSFDVWRDQGPTEANLLGLSSDGWDALVVGDGGTILRRVSAGWRVEPSPTTERLRAVSGEFVVGDHGTLLHRNQGAWELEPTGVDADLHAVDAGAWKERTFAVGAGGVLLQRSADGRVVRVETHTRETLRSLVRWVHPASPSSSVGTSYAPGGINEAIESLIAVGDGGTVVQCALRTDPPLCLPTTPPAQDDLLQVVDAEGANALLAGALRGPSRWLVLRAGGDATALLGCPLPSFPPCDFIDAGVPLPGGMTRVAVPAVPRFMRDWPLQIEGKSGYPPLVAIGRAGAGAFFDGRDVAMFEVPGAPDLNDVRAFPNGGFLAVGDGGAIVTGTLRYATSGLRP